MMRDLKKRVKKVGQPPGTPFYTGKSKTPPHATVINYSEHAFFEKSGASLQECLTETQETNASTWINIEGLSNLSLIEEVATRYKLHPLTVEDILNVEQRPKIDEFDEYLYISFKIIIWNAKKHSYKAEQLSLVLGNNFVITFLENKTSIFQSVTEKLRSSATQKLRQNSCDYLAYRIIDTVVDQYFLVLEGLGDAIEKLEQRIIASPTHQNASLLYRLKRKMLMLRKIVWPMREVISHLLQVEEKLITPYTRIYMRDVYDHVVQSIDTVETFRDMLSSMLDMYLSSLTNRMNEVIKVLTVISTIFIPITFIASLYGMNFVNMPELHWRYGYFSVLILMAVIVIGMLIYFRNKKWL